MAKHYPVELHEDLAGSQTSIQHKQQPLRAYASSSCCPITQ